MARTLAVAVGGLLSASSVAAAQPERGAACPEGACSGRGTCFLERGRALCLCDEGWSAFGLACVPDAEGAGEGGSAPGDAQTELARARRAAGLGERAVAIAAAEIGRRLGRVGREMDDAGAADGAARDVASTTDLGPLGAYLARDEWWCSDFVAWVYARAGAPLTGGAAGGWLLTNNHAVGAWFAERGAFVERRSAGSDFAPRPGDFVRFDTARGGHAAIVERVEGSSIVTIEGNVEGRVARTRYFHFRDNPRIAGFGRYALPHEPPEVSLLEPASGRGPGAPEPELTVVWPSPAHLRARVDDDGPTDQLSMAWSSVEGDRPVTFTPIGALETWARFPRPGRYRLAVTAGDGEHQVVRTLRVEARENRPPRPEIMAPGRAPLSDATRLTAALVDDGLPIAARVEWALVSGPGPVEFSAPRSLETEARFAEPGRYVLGLTANDSRFERAATATIVVADPAGLGCGVARRAGSSTSLAVFVGALWAAARCGALRVARRRRR